MRRAWLSVQASGVAAIVAGVFLLAGLGWALIVAGVAAAVIAEMQT